MKKIKRILILVRQRRCQLPLDLSQHKCFYPTIGDNLGTALQEEEEVGGEEQPFDPAQY